LPQKNASLTQCIFDAIESITVSFCWPGRLLMGKPVYNAVYFICCKLHETVRLALRTIVLDEYLIAVLKDSGTIALRKSNLA